MKPITDSRLAAQQAIEQLTQEQRSQLDKQLTRLIKSRNTKGHIVLNRPVMLEIAKIASIAPESYKTFPYFPKGIDLWNVTVDFLDMFKPGWNKTLPVAPKESTQIAA